MIDRGARPDSYQAILNGACERLRNYNIFDPELDARILLQEASALSHAGLISQLNDAVQPQTVLLFQEMVDRRVRGEPVHRILGYREFYGRKFMLCPQTLIPRPGTEILVDTVLEKYRKSSARLSILDIGTGSGAIAVSLAAELQFANVIAVDVEKAALDQARKNAIHHKVDNRINFILSDVYDNVSGIFDVIVSNPPYIKSHDIAELQQEVREHDPRLALDGGMEGVDFYERIFLHAEKFLNKSGEIILEIGVGQASQIVEIARNSGFLNYSITPDLAGIDRIMSFCR